MVAFQAGWFKLDSGNGGFGLRNPAIMAGLAGLGDESSLAERSARFAIQARRANE